MQANKAYCVFHGSQDLHLFWLKDLHQGTSASEITRAQSTEQSLQSMLCISRYRKPKQSQLATENKRAGEKSLRTDCADRERASSPFLFTKPHLRLPPHLRPPPWMPSNLGKNKASHCLMLDSHSHQLRLAPPRAVKSTAQSFLVAPSHLERQRSAPTEFALGAE